jgi:hypothetical protein
MEIVTSLALLAPLRQGGHERDWPCVRLSGASTEAAPGEAGRLQSLRPEVVAGAQSARVLLQVSAVVLPLAD